MYVSEYCNRVHSHKTPVTVTVRNGIKRSTKVLYVVGYSGSQNGTPEMGKPKTAYIVFSDTFNEGEDTIYRSFYMDDVYEFSSVDNEIWFKDGVLPYKVESQSVISR